MSGKRTARERRRTIAHLITKLELGGAQRNTLYTLKHLDPGKYDRLLITGATGYLVAEAKGEAGYESHFLPALVREIRPLHDLRAFIAITKLLRSSATAHPRRNHRSRSSRPRVS